MQKNRRRLRLRHKEEEQQEHGPRHPENLPLRPAPVFRVDGEAGEEGPDGGTAKGGGDPEGDGVGEVEEGVQVLHGGAATGEGWAAEEAEKEAEEDEATEIVDQGERDGEDGEEGEGGDVGDVAAEGGD